MDEQTRLTALQQRVGGVEKDRSKGSERLFLYLKLCFCALCVRQQLSQSFCRRGHGKRGAMRASWHLVQYYIATGR